MKVDGVNANKNINYFENRNKKIISKKGETKIKIIKNSIPYLNAEIILNTENYINI